MPTTLITRLNNTGVVPGSYTRVTVDAKGRVVTGSNIRFEDGEVRGSISGTSVTLNLLATGVAAASYGSTTSIPVFSVDSKGRITTATTVGISTSLLLQADTGTGTLPLSQNLTFQGSATQILTEFSNNTIKFKFPDAITVKDVVYSQEFRGQLIGSVSANTATINGGSINGTPIGAVNPSTGRFTTVSDTLGDVRLLPILTTSTAYTCNANDNGKLIVISSGNITLPSGLFNPGTNFTIFNNSTGTRSVVPLAGVNVVLVNDGSTGTRTISAYGMATIFYLDSNTVVCSGSGVL